MPTIESIVSLLPEVKEWRRHFHANPELRYEEHLTAQFIADKLRSFGCDEVVTGIGKTGVVGVIKGRAGHGQRVVGLRADMDALPIQEETGLPYASTIAGRMHACGHDGHMAMLLGAAKYLASTRNFEGAAIVVFQPAEEGGAGAKAMCDDGLMDRFEIQKIFAMHTMPGMPIGKFGTAPGPVAASADEFQIRVKGRGGHASQPHKANNPLNAAAEILRVLHSIVQQNVDPMKSAVISVGVFNSGTAGNIIPQTASMIGTVRAYEPEVRETLRQRITEVADHMANVFGVTATVEYLPGYPPTINHDRETDFAVRVASSIVGDRNVEPNHPPLMASEDFAFMLEKRPGNIMLIGNGDSANLHHPGFDFNDEALLYGIAYFVGLVEAEAQA